MEVVRDRFRPEHECSRSGLLDGFCGGDDVCDLTQSGRSKYPVVVGAHSRSLQQKQYIRHNQKHEITI